MYRKYKNDGDNVYIELKMICHKYHIYIFYYLHMGHSKKFSLK